MKLICHVISRNRMVRGICDFTFRHVTPNNKPLLCQVWSPQVTWKRICSFFNLLYDLMWPRDPQVMCKFGSHRSRGSRNITFFISHIITWSGAQSVRRLNWWWPFTINLYLAKFGSHRRRGSGDISFFIYHVTSSSHIIAGSRNFADCGPSA